MKKPAKHRRRRKDARPGEIIAAAFCEFDEKGFGQTTLSDIAARAGISRTTIYLYFESKEAIFEAAIRDRIERTIDEVAQTVRAPQGDFRTIFTQIITLIYDRLVLSDASVVLKVLISEGRTIPDMVSFYRNEILRKGELTIGALIKRGIDSGELNQDCAQFDVRVFIAPAIMSAIWRRVFDDIDPLDIETFKQSHVRLVCDALLGRRDRQ